MLGVNVAVYTVVLLVTKLLIAPFPTVISVEAKFVVDSLDVNVSDSVASFDVLPSDTSEAVIVIVGPMISYVQLNCVAAELSLPDASVNLLAGTSIVHSPSPLGVNVAVYTVVLLVTKLLIAPFPRLISVEAKFVVASLDVNVSDSVALFDVLPSDTSEAVIVIVGPVLSYVQLNCEAAEL